MKTKVDFSSFFCASMLVSTAPCVISNLVTFENESENESENERVSVELQNGSWGQNYASILVSGNSVLILVTSCN